jgi:hypothetical protein
VRQIAPGRTGPKLPKNAIDDPTVVFPLFATPTVLGQQRLDPLPCLVRKLASSDHRCAFLLAATALGREASKGQTDSPDRP